MSKPWILALVLGCAACSSAEASSVELRPMQEISHDEALVKLPGWRNEGPLLMGRLRDIPADVDGTYHAWSLELGDSAEVMVDAQGVDARVRLLRRQDERWSLVTSDDPSGALDQQLEAGEYMVVVQADAGQSASWQLSSACYGRGCPPPSVP